MPALRSSRNQRLQTPPRTRRGARLSEDSATCQHHEERVRSGRRKACTRRGRLLFHPDNHCNEDQDPQVHEDDICPICQLLIYDPVKTTCNHTLCKSCMATWAEVSLSMPMEIISLNEQSRDFDAATGLEARCPMCRSNTSASLDTSRREVLQRRYPKVYAERQAEDAAHDEDRESIQTITLLIGNRHKLIEPAPSDIAQNSHECAFFVQPSRTDIVEEVQFFLHPTFGQNRIVRTRSPFEIRRIGWGAFPITAAIILKAGYTWMFSEAEDSPDGAPNGMLKVDWLLDFYSFEGTGAMGRRRLKVKNDRDWADATDEEEKDNAEWKRMVRSYERDGRYEPPDE